MIKSTVLGISRLDTSVATKTLRRDLNFPRMQAFYFIEAWVRATSLDIRQNSGLNAALSHRRDKCNS
jgi:hypothetical protein